jgi:hypothetical protein
MTFQVNWLFENHVLYIPHMLSACDLHDSLERAIAMINERGAGKPVHVILEDALGLLNGKAFDSKTAVLELRHLQQHPLLGWLVFVQPNPQDGAEVLLTSRRLQIQPTLQNAIELLQRLDADLTHLPMRTPERTAVYELSAI